MKKFLCLLLCGIFFSTYAFAFPIEVEILSEKQIAKLSDERLIEIYIDVIVEIEAAKTFHNVSGFQPKEIGQFKDLLRFRIMLIIEMQKRKMEVPKVP